MEEKLAINGGMPVRSEPYPKHTTMIDKKEEQLVIELLRDGELSVFQEGQEIGFWEVSMLKKWSRR